MRDKYGIAWFYDVVAVKTTSWAFFQQHLPRFFGIIPELRDRKETYKPTRFHTTAETAEDGSTSQTK